uniref:Uncharacterized protein n=1 Tax=Rhizophora mucronata TaxID=61149 RepID=A0A2P2PX97_RHIMU
MKQVNMECGPGSIGLRKQKGYTKIIINKYLNHEKTKSSSKPLNASNGHTQNHKS